MTATWIASSCLYCVQSVCAFVANVDRELAVYRAFVCLLLTTSDGYRGSDQGESDTERERNQFWTLLTAEGCVVQDLCSQESVSEGV